MDFLIQTAWYSIEERGHAMAFHGTPSVLQGTPWDSMELYDIPWNSMDLQGDSVELHGIPWNSMDTPWILMDFHRFPWNSMEFHGGISHGFEDNFFLASFHNIHRWCVYSNIDGTLVSLSAFSEGVYLL